MLIQTRVTVRKRLSWVLTSVTLTFDLWPWPFAWTSLLSLVITPENFMMIWWWEHGEKGVTDRRTDGQTDRQTDGLNQSYSCLVAAKNNIYTTVPGISSPMENHSCPESARCWVWFHSACACQSVWPMGLYRVVTTLGTIVGGGVALRVWGLRSNLKSCTSSNSLITGIHPFCQCAETRSRVLFIQNNEM